RRPRLAARWCAVITARWRCAAVRVEDPCRRLARRTCRTAAQTRPAVRRRTEKATAHPRYAEGGGDGSGVKETIRGGSPQYGGGGRGNGPRSGARPGDGPHPDPQARPGG